MLGSRARARAPSAVSVLAESGDELETVGRVGDLGRGEEIYAVRFVGEVGFVVTFEQTDPLYALDLSDPADPRVTGELKIPGYSAYLHPVGGELLLGIGQSGTDSGQVTGSQASLFDVGDLSDPQRVDKLELARGQWSSSAAEFDHHAFAYVPDRELALVPVSSYGGERFGGAVAVGVGAGGELEELARFEDGHGYRGQIERMLVSGDNLVTVSQQGISIRDLDGFERTGSASFASD